MKPGMTVEVLLVLDDELERQAVQHGLEELPEDHATLQMDLLRGFSSLGTDTSGDPPGGQVYIPLPPGEAAFAVTVDNQARVRQACEATLGIGGIKGAILKVFKVKAAARSILTELAA